jgi:short-subunit dehydrogenase
MTKDTWLILGGSSPIARAFGALVAADGAQVLLCGRDLPDLRLSAADLNLRFDIATEAIYFDAADIPSHQVLASELSARLGNLNICVIAGRMDDQTAIDADCDLAQATITATFSGIVSILHHLAPRLESQGGGKVIIFGSVAGDRGRLKNYVYGAAKAGLHAYAQGLRARLWRSGVHVMTVKPGFIDTAMTWGKPGIFLAASPEAIATASLSAARRGCHVIYFPWFWRGIMLIIRLIPEQIFKRLSI